MSSAARSRYDQGTRSPVPGQPAIKIREVPPQEGLLLFLQPCLDEFVSIHGSRSTPATNGVPNFDPGLLVHFAHNPCHQVFALMQKPARQLENE